MERSDWTDQRLDDRFDHLDSEAHAMRQDIRELRSELGGRIDDLGARIDQFGGRIDQFGGRIDAQGAGLRGEIQVLQRQMGELHSLVIRINSASLVAMGGVIAAILTRGI